MNIVRLLYDTRGAAMNIVSFMEKKFCQFFLIILFFLIATIQRPALSQSIVDGIVGSKLLANFTSAIASANKRLNLGQAECYI